MHNRTDVVCSVFVTARTQTGPVRSASTDDGGDTAGATHGGPADGAGAAEGSAADGSATDGSATEQIADPGLARELADALSALGVRVGVHQNHIVADGQPLTLPLLERAHPHPGVVAEMVDNQGSAALLVADRLSQSARQVLRDAGWSWLDRRGHLRIWVPGLRVDAPIGLGSSDGRGASTSPWTPVGLEIALHVLMHPDQEVSARRIAADTGRSPGGTQEIVNRFGAEGLIGSSTRLPLLPDLFWEATSRWPDDGWMPVPVGLAEASEVVGAGKLLRVDERAATLGGARIPAAADLPARCYVGKDGLRRLRALGVAGPNPSVFVRLAPVRWLPELEGFEPDEAHPWRIAHPLLCALRIGADRARGHEIVEDWGVVPE